MARDWEVMLSDPIEGETYHHSTATECEQQLEREGE